MKKTTKDLISEILTQGTEEEKESIKKLNTFKNEYSDSYVSNCLEDDGYFHVKVKVKNKDDLFGPFSNDPSDEVKNYIETSTIPFKKKDAIAVDIYVDDISEEEKTLFIKNFREGYSIQYEQYQKKVILNRVLSGIFMLIGIVILCVYGFLLYQNSNGNRVQIIPEILSIAAWVFIWDSVELFFFNAPENRIKQLVSFRFAIAQIHFYSK